MKLLPNTPIFMIGIGGSGMRGLAYLLAQQSHIITGTDSNWSSVAQDATLREYTLAAEGEAEPLVAASKLIIYSDAVPFDHPLRQSARASAIPELAYHEALGDFAAGFETIAITGTHGKSSTTAMLSHIFTTAGFDPVVLIGASVPAWDNSNARWGKGRFFIVEADEYRKHFLTLKPAHAIITTIDFDHPDFFASLTDVVTAYSEFMQHISPTGTLVTTNSIRDTYPQLPWLANTAFVAPPQVKLALALPGAHMQYNAALAITLAQRCGIDREQASDALRSFTGLGRRFEQLGSYQNLQLISDYGHHPAEIAATLGATRQQYPHASILALVEVHMLERLSTFFKEYVQVLAQAPIDGVLLCPTFKAKGRNTTQQDLSQSLFEELRILRPSTWQLSDYTKLGTTLAQLDSRFSIGIAFSAGTLDGKLRQLPLT